MLTSKQRAKLRSMANSIEPTVWVGKDGVTQAVANAVLDAFNTKELLKLALLESCPDAANEVCSKVCNMCSCEGVQVIGRKVVLYKKSEKLENKPLKTKREHPHGTTFKHENAHMQKKYSKKYSTDRKVVR